MSMDIMKPILL